MRNQEILSIDGVTEVIAKRQSLHVDYRANGIEGGGMCDILTEQNYSAVEATLIDGTMPLDARSIIIDSHQPFLLRYPECLTTAAYQPMGMEYFTLTRHLNLHRKHYTALVLFGMELILSVWTVRRQKKQSLIEQMRAIE